jgi:2-polyprenyl-3-methyl-5-hydroxy-6-metoxy-1,4-benzoquinol methylase
MTDIVSQQVLNDMKTYYQERACEYDEWFYRKGRYDHSPETTRQWIDETQMVFDALADFPLTGDVLELAPGTGIWTERLITTAKTVTAVDASSNMIEMNRAKVGSDKITYIQADLFTWKPNRCYDAVVFCFWLSHVPVERMDDFLRFVASMLHPGGRVFFVDSRPQPTMSASNHTLPESGSQIMARKLNDGRSFDIVKNFFEPHQLEQQCANAGLNVTVRETPNYFVYGTGLRIPD